METAHRIDPRWVAMVAIAVAATVAWLALGLRFADAVPSRGGAATALQFFSAALTPALDYEDASLPANAPPFLWQALVSAWYTVAYAAAAISLATVIALPLGFFASSAWWSRGADGIASRHRSVFARGVGPAVLVVTRAVLAFLRSIHELLWAAMFLAAFGLTPLSAVLAIALPYTGTLAKIVSEMVDEAPRDTAVALRAAGAAPGSVFAFGLVPRALPDIAAYAFYRFECGLRSSAVLGFFGLPTLGLSIKLSFENLHYAEVWTYLYLLLGLVVLLEAWSGAMRRRLVA